jgi:hypothetical protein
MLDNLLYLLCIIGNIRTVEDFDDWTNWLLYKGGVGVKGDNSWESWWDEEQVSKDAPVFELYIYFNPR